MILKKLDIQKQKYEVGTLPYLIENLTQWIKKLNYKILRRKHSLNLHDLGLGKDLLDMTPMHKQPKK